MQQIRRRRDPNNKICMHCMSFEEYMAECKHQHKMSDKFRNFSYAMGLRCSM